MNNENEPTTKAVPNQHLQAIPKLEFELPVMINKSVIGERLLIDLDFMQTGGGSIRIERATPMRA